MGGQEEETDLEKQHKQERPAREREKSEKGGSKRSMKGRERSKDWPCNKKRNERQAILRVGNGGQTGRPKHGELRSCFQPA